LSTGAWAKPATLAEHLKVVQDHAQEDGEWRIARELGEMVDRLKGHHPTWTAAGVAITLGFDQPRPLVGRNGGRSTRMMCQAVSDAANGHLKLLARPASVR
jgi:hypothetical protein